MIRLIKTPSWVFFLMGYFFFSETVVADEKDEAVAILSERTSIKGAEIEELEKLYDSLVALPKGNGMKCYLAITVIPPTGARGGNVPASIVGEMSYPILGESKNAIAWEMHSRLEVVELLTIIDYSTFSFEFDVEKKKMKYLERKHPRILGKEGLNYKSSDMLKKLSKQIAVFERVKHEVKILKSASPRKSVTTSTIIGLSRLAHLGYGGGSLPKEYKELDSSSSILSGFNAVVLKSESTGSVAIAFAGTDSLLDMECDYRMLQNKIPLQFHQALNFVREQRKIKGRSNVFVVGHSLGGSLATYVGLKEDIPSVAFNSPGINLEMIKGIPKGNLSKSTPHFNFEARDKKNRDFITNAPMKFPFMQHPPTVDRVSVPAHCDAFIACHFLDNFLDKIIKSRNSRQ